MTTHIDAPAYEYVSDEISSSLECAICRNPFIEPKMAPACQHIFCSSCITKALSLSASCPIDRLALKVDNLVEPPRIVGELLDELKVRCWNKEHGCVEVMQRSNANRHWRSCKVTGAKGKGKERQIDSDDEHEVPGVTGTEGNEEEEVWVVCDLCRVDLLAKDLESHPSTCASAIIYCKYCHAKFTRAQLSSHHRTSCPSIPIPCPHARHGCQARVSRSLMTEEHLDVSCAYEPLKEYLNAQRDLVERIVGENWELKQRVGRLDAEMTEMKEVLNGVRKGMGDLWVAPEANIASRDMLEPSSSSLGFFGTTSLPVLSPSSPSSTRNPLSPNSTRGPPSTLSTHLSSLEQSLSTLHLSHQQLDNQISQQMHHDSLRSAEEISSLRAITHGLRVQMHHLMMEVNRLSLGSPSGRRGMIGGINAVGGGSGSSGGDSEGSDEELGGGWLRPSPSMMGRRMTDGGMSLPVGMRMVGSSGGAGMKL